MLFIHVFRASVRSQFVPALAAYYTTDYCRIKVYAVGRHRRPPVFFTQSLRLIMVVT